MTRTRVPRRFHRLTRIAVSLVAASALALSGGILTAAPASATEPLVGTCLNTSAGQISVGLAGTVPGTLLPGVVLVKVFDSNGTFLGESAQVTLGPLGTINLDNLLIPLTGPLPPTGVNFQVVDLLGNILTPIVGDTPCDSLPIDGITGAYHALNPSRILDTRYGTGGSTKIPAHGTISLVVEGQGGVPAQGVEAANLDLTATGGGAAGNITVYPTGTTRPNTSSLNFVQGRDVANTVFAQLNSAGSVSFYNNSTQPVNLVADVAGYFEGGALTLLPGAYQPLSASRILDTRSAGGPYGPLSTHTLQVGTRGGIPLGVSAAVLNLTVTNATARGHITAYPSNQTLPYASNINFVAGQSNADLVVVPLSPDGKINLHSGSVAGTVDVIVDVVGYFKSGIVPARTPGLQANVNAPKRLFDSRHLIGTTIPGKVASHDTRAVQIDGQDGIPSSFVRAVFVTVTTTEEEALGSITEFPGGTRPNTSILNFTPTRDIANLVLASVGSDGKIRLYNGSAAPTHLVVDVSGYITGATVSVG